MPLKSSLRLIRQSFTVDVIETDIVSGLEVESVFLSDLMGTHQQESRSEDNTSVGAIVNTTDTWIFERNPATGLLPPITEKHILDITSVNSGVRYDVKAIDDQGGEGNRLFVLTNKTAGELVAPAPPLGGGYSIGYSIGYNT